MDEKLKQAYLFDFYGEMLNAHQRRIYEDFMFNDLSLGEIAAEEGISRQGVADMVRRCGKKTGGLRGKTALGRQIPLRQVRRGADTHARGGI
jgi:predicted DNA-binding protein YlxM (UPF0122 family)